MLVVRIQTNLMTGTMVPTYLALSTTRPGVVYVLEGQAREKYDLGGDVFTTIIIAYRPSLHHNSLSTNAKPLV